MAIKLEMLKCFVTVAEQGNLSEASEILGRTPSAVSMMLKQFEDHIGPPLFETARKSRLTPLGNLIYEESARQLRHFENSISVIEGLARSELGYLRLAVTPSVATTFLPPLILKFTTKFPKVQIDIRDMDSAAIARALAQEQADIGIGTLPNIEGMHKVEFTSDPFGIVCRTDHFLATNWDDLTWRDVEDQVLIANGLCHLISDPEFLPILAKSRLMVRNTVSLVALVKEGIGITVLPRLALSQLHDDITFLPLAKGSIRRIVHLVSQPQNQLMPAAREFLKIANASIDHRPLQSRPGDQITD